jgi:hypothetical protein
LSVSIRHQLQSQFDISLKSKLDFSCFIPEQITRLSQYSYSLLGHIDQDPSGRLAVCIVQKPAFQVEQLSKLGRVKLDISEQKEVERQGLLRKGEITCKTLNPIEADLEYPATKERIERHSQQQGWQAPLGKTQLPSICIDEDANLYEDIVMAFTEDELTEEMYHPLASKDEQAFHVEEFFSLFKESETKFVAIP